MGYYTALTETSQLGLAPTLMCTRIIADSMSFYSSYTCILNDLISNNL